MAQYAICIFFAIVKTWKKSRYNKTEEPVILDIEYEANSLIKQIKNFNGTTTTNIYDPGDFYRLTNKLTTTTEGKNLQNLSYVYDTENNVKKIIDNSETNLKKLSEFQYDDLHRLIKATTSNTANQQDYEEIYKYSPSGNILFKTGQGIYQYEETVNSSNPTVNPHAVRQIIDPITNKIVKKFEYDKAMEMIEEISRMLWSTIDNLEKKIGLEK